MAEDLIYAKITKKIESMESYVESKRSEYYRGDLKPIFESLKLAAKSIDQVSH